MTAKRVADRRSNWWLIAAFALIGLDLFSSVDVSDALVVGCLVISNIWWAADYLEHRR